MRNRKFRMTHYLSPTQFLSKVKKDIQRQLLTQIIEENLMYLNNSFTNNIQMKQILVDICKAKKDCVRSKELKAMYMLFTQNKANSLIFQKIARQEILNTKNQKAFNDTSNSKWSSGLNDIIEEQEQENQINFQKNTHRRNSSSRSSINQKNSFFFQKKRQQSQNLILNFENNQTEEHRFLMKRTYCRLIQKILVKIAFYTMNHKFLDFLSSNMLELTRNLQKIIRRLNNIKDLNFFQQTVLKIFRQNFIIENKILEILVDEGFIMSIDEFYRVNGVDVPHQEVYERIDPMFREEKPKRKLKMTLKQKIAQMKSKREKQTIVKQDYIERTNQQINEKYLHCISQIKYLINEDEKNEQKKEKNMSQVDESDVKSKKSKVKRNRNSLSKQPFLKQTLNVVLSPNKQRQKEQKFDYVIEGKKQISRESSDSESLNYWRRKSAFSSQFSQIMKQATTSPNKLQRNSAVLSVKILEFKNLTNHTRKESNGLANKTSQNQFQKIQNQKKFKRVQEIYETSPIKKILKLYEARNADRYNIDDFLGPSINLPKDVQEILKQELFKLQQLYRKPHSIQPSCEKFGMQNAEMNLIKLAKDRCQNVQNTEKIHSKNYSIFTSHGVKNLCGSGEKDHCENSKLKKIPYTKLKEKEKTASVLPSSNTFDLIKNPTTCTTNFATKKYSQSEHNSIQDENLQKTISQLFNIKTPSKAQTLNANKIYTKDNTLHKKFVYFKREVENEFGRRKDRLKTFNSNFMNEVKNNRDKEKQNTFNRTKQVKTSDWKNRIAFSEPVSPTSSPKKQF